MLYECLYIILQLNLFLTLFYLSLPLVLSAWKRGKHDKRLSLLNWIFLGFTKSEG